MAYGWGSPCFNTILNVDFRHRILANIGVCAAACLAGICSPAAASGQIYSVRPAAVSIQGLDWQEAALSFPHMQFYAGPVASLQILQDADGVTVTDGLYGGAAGVRVYLTRSLSVGAEAQYLPQGRVKIPFMGYLRQRAVYAVARWNLTPDTLPSLRLELGAGRMETVFKLELSPGRVEKLSSPAFFAGGGASFWLGKGVELDLSLRALYMQKTDFDFLLHYASRLGMQGSLFLSLRF